MADQIEKERKRMMMMGAGAAGVIGLSGYFYYQWKYAKVASRKAAMTTDGEQDDALVSTPYGQGRVIEETGEMVSVKLPFGVAHLQRKHLLEQEKAEETSPEETSPEEKTEETSSEETSPEEKAEEKPAGSEEAATTNTKALSTDDNARISTLEAEIRTKAILEAKQREVISLLESQLREATMAGEASAAKLEAEQRKLTSIGEKHLETISRLESQLREATLAGETSAAKLEEQQRKMSEMGLKRSLESSGELKSVERGGSVTTASSSDVEPTSKNEACKHSNEEPGSLLEQLGEGKIEKFEGSSMGALSSICSWSAVSLDVASQVPNLPVWRVQLLGYPESTNKGLSGSLSRMTSVKSLFSISESKAELDLESEDDRSRGKYLVVTVVNEMGSILGRSAQTATGKLLNPVHFVGGSLDAPRYMFLQLKRIKKKGAMQHKFSDIGYSIVDLAGDFFTPGEQRLIMYKKPVDFTRDPSKMKVSGLYMDVDVSPLKGASRFSAA
uniref:Uncharacterized protein n=1 Tax=Lotharella globosa TaxID=91324 RepID=A0A7S3Z4X9_9EUKA